MAGSQSFTSITGHYLCNSAIICIAGSLKERKAMFMAAKKNGKHLTFEDRNKISFCIAKGESKTTIAALIGSDPTTIAKEIKRGRILHPGRIHLRMSQCAVYKTCKKRSSCSKSCRNYVPFQCKRRDRSPGACNGCPTRVKCPYDKYDYNDIYAQREYEKKLHESRQGVNLTPEEAQQKGALVKQLLSQGQAPVEIIANNPDLGFCERTLYNYIENGVFRSAGVNNMDLRRKVSRRNRMPQEKANDFKKRRSYAFLKGRTMDDYRVFLDECKENGIHVSVVEMDTMYNDVTNGPFIQTFKIVDAQIALAVYHEEKTAAAMANGVDIIEQMLGRQLFESLFTVLIPDRGSEFEKPESLELRKDGSQRTRVFYCDPMASWQKPHVEGKHVEYRYILPKKSDLHKLGLTSQKQLNLVLSHLNSRTLDSTIGIGKQTPFQFARFFYPDLVDRMFEFGIDEVDGNYVTLKPYLLNEKRRNEEFAKIHKLLSRKAVLKPKK